MRTIYILRGAPASGKSTWIENNHLEQYTLSADKIRVMYQSPILIKRVILLLLKITMEKFGNFYLIS